MDEKKALFKKTKKAYKKAKRKALGFWKTLAIICLVLTIILVPVNIVLTMFDNTIAAFAGGTFWELENEEDEEEEEDTSSTAATTSDASSTVTDSSKPTQSDNQAGADIGEPDHDKMLTTYIIIGAAALIVIAAAVVTIIIVKKKKKAE